MSNPGPASITTANTQISVESQTWTSSPPTPNNANPLRLLASARGVSLASTGDAATIPVVNAGVYSVLYVVVTNAQVSGASGSIASAALGVFTAAATGGTAIVANASLTGVSGNTVVSQRTVASTAAWSTNGAGAFAGAATPNLYVNVGTALANATCDVFVYGFDLT